MSSGEKTVWAGSPSAVCGRGVYFCLPLMRRSQIVRITPEWQKAHGREAGCGESLDLLGWKSSSVILKTP